MKFARMDDFVAAPKGVAKVAKKFYFCRKNNKDHP